MITEILTQMVADEIEEEGLTDAVHAVMLDVAYSPVIPHKGGEPVEVKATTPNGYIIDDPIRGLVNVTPEALKVMRARYIVNRSTPQLSESLMKAFNL